ncbi:MAG: hypothetical protein DCC65_06660 [Planctomycetota bacterium]|nr:MAG: hypothetical protein DCC65_06660 [Planctomycetota bacterium]
MTRFNVRRRLGQLAAAAIVLAGMTGCSQSVTDAPSATRPAAPRPVPAKPAQVAPSPGDDANTPDDVSERDQDRHPSRWKKKLKALYA